MARERTVRAMILAAGRGERLRPLSDEIPKPLVEVNRRPLIHHLLDSLSCAGFTRIVVNLAHLGDMIRDSLGDGRDWGVKILYSEEPPGALETGGGIALALPLLGATPFLVVNGDIFSDFDFGQLRSIKCDHAHLVLVPKPSWRARGDFALQHGRVQNEGEVLHTFSGIGVYHPRFFDACDQGRWSVVPLLRQTVENQLVTGSIHRGLWHDAGTISRLEDLRSELSVS